MSGSMFLMFASGTKSAPSEFRHASDGPETRKSLQSAASSSTPSRKFLGPKSCSSPMRELSGSSAAAQSKCCLSTSKLSLSMTAASALRERSALGRRMHH
eukprot:6189352-Pleurochrysis_carterae.AAC.1